MSSAEITMKSGAVVKFDCSSIKWKQKKNLLGEVMETNFEWVTPEGATRRPVHFDLDEIAAIVFVDGGESA